MITALTALALIIGTGVLVGAGLLFIILCTDLLWPIAREWCAVRVKRYRLWRNDCGYTPWRAFWTAMR